MVMMVMMVREFYRIRIPIQEPQLIICFYRGSVMAHYNLSRLKTAFVSLSPASLPNGRGVDRVLKQAGELRVEGLYRQQEM